MIPLAEYSTTSALGRVLPLSQTVAVRHPNQFGSCLVDQKLIKVATCIAKQLAVKRLLFISSYSSIASRTPLIYAVVGPPSSLNPLRICKLEAKHMSKEAFAITTQVVLNENLPFVVDLLIGCFREFAPLHCGCFDIFCSYCSNLTRASSAFDSRLMSYLRSKYYFTQLKLRISSMLAIR